MVLPLYLGQLVGGSVRHGQQRGDVHPRALEQSLGAIVLAQHGPQHMGWLNIGMVLGQRRALRLTQGLLELGR